MKTTYPIMTANEVAELISNGSTIGFSGFTSAGACKVIPKALADKAKNLHAQNKKYKLRVMAGASTCQSLDGALAEADAISQRIGYQSTKELRNKINNEEIDFVDLHLSHLPQQISNGFLGKIDFAIVEATDITPDGKIFLSTSIGISPTILEHTNKVFIELNEFHSTRLSEMADITEIQCPPNRGIIPVYNPLDKIGKPYVKIDPKKIIGIVKTNKPDEVGGFTKPDETSEKISEHVVNFLISEMYNGRIPKEFLPVQSGVGNIGNAVMKGLGENKDLPPFTMFTEVFQDSLVELMENDRLIGASTCSLTISQESLKKIYSNMDFFAPRIVLRQQEISNNPTLARQLGVIAINTALEADIYGNVNSTHVCGTRLMNGIGGSGDFTRNAYISIFVCPSIAKGGKISSIVPMVPHVDSNEHSVQVIITEQGVADLRGISPRQRAHEIINNCVSPMYRDYMNKYIESCSKNHIRHNLSKCFELHQNLLNTGKMLP